VTEEPGNVVFRLLALQFKEKFRRKVVVIYIKRQHPTQTEDNAVCTDTVVKEVSFLGFGSRSTA
jgi:hypothetical protein